MQHSCMASAKSTLRYGEVSRAIHSLERNPDARKIRSGGKRRVVFVGFSYFSSPELSTFGGCVITVASFGSDSVGF